MYAEDMNHLETAHTALDSNPRFAKLSSAARSVLIPLTALCASEGWTVKGFAKMLTVLDADGTVRLYCDRETGSLYTPRVTAQGNISPGGYRGTLTDMIESIGFKG